MIIYEDEKPKDDEKAHQEINENIGRDYRKKIESKYLSEELKKIIKFSDNRILNNQYDYLAQNLSNLDRNNQMKKQQSSKLENNEINEINIKSSSFLMKEDCSNLNNEFDNDNISVTFTEFNENLFEEKQNYHQEKDFKIVNDEIEENILVNELKFIEKNNNISNNNHGLNNISNISHIQPNMDDDTNSFFFENSQGEIENYKISQKKKRKLKHIENSNLYITLDPTLANEILSMESHRNWEDHITNQNLVKGKYSKDETLKLIKSIVRYAHKYNIDFATLINQILDTKTRSKSSIWCEIGKALPNRSIKSISDYSHRIFNPYNNKGLWSIEEIEKLIMLYNELGGRWKIIGDIMQRHPENVRDKWKNLYKIKSEERKIYIEKPWNLLTTLKLLKHMNEYIIESCQNEAGLLKWGYKFSKMFQSGDFEGDRYLDEGEEILFLDYRLKYFSQKNLINDICKTIINFDVLSKISLELIDFKLLSDKFDLKQKILPSECHKKFCEILTFFKNSNTSNENNFSDLSEIKLDKEINKNPNLKKCLIEWKTKRKFESNKYLNILQKTYEKFIKVKNSYLLKN